MPTEKESLDYFGQFLMENYRDRALKTLEIAINKKWKGESLQEFQDFLQTLPVSQQKVLSGGFQAIIDGALHDLLFNLQEENLIASRIKIFVDEHDVIQMSDGIYGEQYGKNGWIEKFSMYKDH